MTLQVPARRLKMNARRRSPFMLLLGLLTAGAPGPAAARAGTSRKEAPAPADAVPERRLGEVGWIDDPFPVDPELEPWFDLKPRPRVEMLWQTGWQVSRAAGRAPRYVHEYEEIRRQFTHDLGLLVRGSDGHLWGGATTVIWQYPRRTLYGLKAVRRWSIDRNSDAYLQLAPGMIVGGEEDGVDIGPGALLELEAGSRWVALTAGVHSFGWSAPEREYWLEEGSGRELTWYVGGRCHGAVGLGIYLGLVMVFIASYRSN